jgi:methyltransferase (TIGR00027 family)
MRRDAPVSAGQETFMKAGFPSKTAVSAAAHRAVHQFVDFPHVFRDPLALAIVGPADLVFMVECAGAWLAACREMRAFIVARSRYAEDQLARAVAAGTAQYVILGAGLDTFAYRHPFSHKELRIFEVDHPDTQAWKLRRLAEAAIPVPSDVSFVPFDFERRGLDLAMEKAGLRLGEPTFFSFLGVSPYLANDVVMGILALIHSLCPDNAVAFDYAAPRETLPSWEMLEFDAVSARVRQISEPFRAFFSPQALISDLKAIGFRRVENPTTEELNALYFRHRLDALVLRHELLRMMCAY